MSPAVIFESGNGVFPAELEGEHFVQYFRALIALKECYHAFRYLRSSDGWPVARFGARAFGGFLVCRVAGDATRCTELYLLKDDPSLVESRLKDGPTAEHEKSQKINRTPTAILWCLSSSFPESNDTSIPPALQRCSFC
jgi:hypothetical protein